jgi:aconitase A
MAAISREKALEKGMQAQTMVKTSLAPAHKSSLDSSNLCMQKHLRWNLGFFDLVGYGCTTCIQR